MKITAKKAWGHLKTITRHRFLVMVGCFRVGLIRQGLTHDLSKYSTTEFLEGARYYQGTRSPNAAEREDKGYSEAWMHHKGRNRHHYEYWTDMSPETHRYEPVMMPVERVPWIMAETLLSASVMSLTTEVPELTLSTWP